MKTWTDSFVVVNSKKSKTNIAAPRRNFAPVEIALRTLFGRYHNPLVDIT